MTIYMRQENAFKFACWKPSRDFKISTYTNVVDIKASVQIFIDFAYPSPKRLLSVSLMHPLEIS